MMGSINTSFDTCGGKQSFGGLYVFKESPHRSPFQEADQNLIHATFSSSSPFQYVSIKESSTFKQQQQIILFIYLIQQQALTRQCSQNNGNLVPQKSLQQSPLKSHAFQMINHEVEDFGEDTYSMIPEQRELEQLSQTNINLRQTGNSINRSSNIRESNVNFCNFTTENGDLHEFSQTQSDYTPQPQATLPLPENHAKRFIEMSIDFTTPLSPQQSIAQIARNLDFPKQISQTLDQFIIHPSANGQSTNQKPIYSTTCDIPKVQYQEQKSIQKQRSPKFAKAIQNFIINEEGQSQKQQKSSGNSSKYSSINQRIVGTHLSDFINAKQEQVRKRSVMEESNDITPRILNYQMQQMQQNQTSRTAALNEQNRLQSMKQNSIMSPETERNKKQKKGGVMSKINAAIKDMNLNVIVDFAKIKKPSRLTQFVGLSFAYLLCLLNNYKVDPVVFKDWSNVISILSQNPSYLMHQINQLKEKLQGQISHQEYNLLYLDHLNNLLSESKQLLQQITDKNCKIILALVQSVIEHLNNSSLQEDISHFSSQLFSPQSINQNVNSSVIFKSNDYTPCSTRMVKTSRKQNDFKSAERKINNEYKSIISKNKSPSNENKFNLFSPQGALYLKNQYASVLERNKSKLEEYTKRASSKKIQNTSRQFDQTPIKHTIQDSIKDNISCYTNLKKSHEKLYKESDKQNSQIKEALKKQIATSLNQNQQILNTHYNSRADTIKAKYSSQSHQTKQRVQSTTISQINSLAQAKSPVKELLKNIKQQHGQGQKIEKSQERQMKHNFQGQIESNLHQKQKQNSYIEKKLIDFKSPQIEKTNQKTERPQIKAPSLNPFTSSQSYGKVQLSQKKTRSDYSQNTTSHFYQNDAPLSIDIKTYNKDTQQIPQDIISSSSSTIYEPKEVQKIMRRDMLDVIMQKAHEIEKNMRGGESSVDRGMIEQIKKRRLEQIQKESQERAQ